MTSKSKLRVGDVISFTLDPGRIAIGHVIGDYMYPGYHFVALFGPFEAIPADLKKVLARKPALLGLTMDSRVRSGDWKLMGHETVRDGSWLPAFQISHGSIENVIVEDFSGRLQRPATVEERKTLPHREVSSPHLIERAMRSLAGLEPWLEAFDSLRPSDVATTKRMFD